MAKTKKDQSGGWSLGEFSDMLRRQGEEKEAQLQDSFKRFRDEMPQQIADLKTHSNQDLLDLFLKFSAYRSDRREMELWQEFNGHIQTEILRRMSADRSEELRGLRLPPIGRRRS